MNHDPTLGMGNLLWSSTRRVLPDWRDGVAPGGGGPAAKDLDRLFEDNARIARVRL